MDSAKTRPVPGPEVRLEFKLRVGLLCTLRDPPDTVSGISRSVSSTALRGSPASEPHAVFHLADYGPAPRRVGEVTGAFVDHLRAVLLVEDR